MKAAQVMVHGDNAVWTGSLREFFRTNEYDLADARALTAELRSNGRAIVGGGAAPAFTIAAIDTKPGAYYVSMVDGQRFALLSGPYLNDHAAALADVEPAKKIAQDVDSRAHWYAFGTCRLEPDVDHPPGVLQKHGLMSTIESPARASCGALHGGDSTDRP